MARIPIVDHLVLEPDPHLVAQQCSTCGARFFGRRNACASCGGTGFEAAEVSPDGEVTAFTIVTFAAPGIDVPFVAAVVDCDGTTVAGNVINTPPDTDHVHLGMKVKLATYSLGEDTNGDEGVGYAFEPAEGSAA